MADEYRINPCKACVAKYGLKDINQVNSCCVETASAFAGTVSTNDLVGTEAGANCDACLNSSKLALGRSPCEFRLTKAVTWAQTPHYFPTLLHETRDKNKALEMCIAKCNEQGGSLFRQCIDACQIDYDAVEAVEKYTKSIETKPPSKKKKRFTWPYSWRATWIVLGIVILVLTAICIFSLCRT